MGKIVAYLRVSTKEQANSGLGISAQLDSVKAAYGPPDAVYVDDGVSGKIPNRPGLTAALDGLSAGDTLVVAKLDRLARDLFLGLWIKKEIKKRNAYLRSCSDGECTDKEDPVSKLMQNIVMAFADYERSLIAARTTNALEQKKKRGEKTGGCVPYGFNVVEVNDCKVLEENSDEQAIIKYMQGKRDMFSSSYFRIARDLNNQRVPTKTGVGKWQPSTVQRILDDDRSRTKTVPGFKVGPRA